MCKQLLFWLALVTMLVVSAAIAQQSPSTSEELKQVSTVAAPIVNYAPTPADLSSFENSDLLTAGYCGG